LPSGRSRLSRSALHLASKAALSICSWGSAPNAAVVDIRIASLCVVGVRSFSIASSRLLFVFRRFSERLKTALAPRLAVANAIEALLDGREARLDVGLEFGVGENLRPVVLYAFANEFAHIRRIDAFFDLVGDKLEHLRGPHCGHRLFADMRETRRLVPPRRHDLRADEAGTKHGDADAARRQFAAQPFRKRDAIFGYVINIAAPRDEPCD
jgi:hypothetical protein